MARNHKFYFDSDRVPRARGPAAERLLMQFLENDVQGSDHVCHDLLEDLIAIEDGSDDSRDFIGNAHSLELNAQGATITALVDDASVPARYHAALKHFREVLEDWEAFILDDQIDGQSIDDEILA